MFSLLGNKRHTGENDLHIFEISLHSILTMTGFLDLPGEIRNRIYILVFPEKQLLLRYSHPKKPSNGPSGRTREASNKRSTQLHTILVPAHGPCGHSQEVIFSAQLLRVCREIQEEALPLLYTSVALHFESTKAINCFLSVASSRGMEQITKVAIIQPGYGEPHFTRNTIWKAKHDQRWLSTCKRIAQKMTGIQHLRLCLEICDWPCQLNLSADWAKPLFFLKGPDGLSRVDISLHSNSFSKQRLEAASRMVERAMTSARGRADRKLEDSLQELARLEKRKPSAQPKGQTFKDTSNTAWSSYPKDEAKKPKARKVLIIKIAESSKGPLPMATYHSTR